MTDQDPNFQQTTRTTVSEADLLRPGQPQHVETTETTVTGRQTSNTAWWIAGLVALAAIIGVVWMVVSTNQTRQDTLTAEADAQAQAEADALAVRDAIDDARIQGQIQGAQDSATAVIAAQAAADRAAAEAAAARAEAARDAQPPVVVIESQDQPQTLPPQQ